MLRSAKSLLLLTKTESLDKCTIALDICVLKILKKITALTYHLKKSTSAVVILGVSLHVLSELSDTCSKNRYLYLG